ncbi:hypothetical protein H3S80_05075 [Bartonella sp. M0177]|nr:hypothetical protein [Bartonella sp. M0177]MBI0003425.1 hypothetical protein [Bartonella sp. M0177]
MTRYFAWWGAALVPRDRKYRHFFTSNSWRYLLKNEGVCRATLVRL